MSASGTPTKFETDKEKLRRIIRKALEAATNFDEFAELLSRQDVTVKQSRGRLSYLTSDRAKPITARRLGDDFDLTAIRTVFEQKSRQLGRNGEQGMSILDRLQTAKNAKIDTYHDSVSRMVDITPEKGAGFEHWAKVFNLMQSAKSVTELEKYGFDSLEELQIALAVAKADKRDYRDALKAVEAELYGKKELLKRVLAYANTKPIWGEYRALKSDKARAKYHKTHESEFIIMESAKRYFAEHCISKIPSYKILQSEIERLTSQQNELYDELHEKRDEVKRLQTISDNIAKTLHFNQEKIKLHDKNKSQE